MLSSGCDVHECHVLLLEGVRIGERATCPLGEIWMELIRIALRTPCHPGEGSLHLAHTDGPPLHSIAQSTMGGILCADISYPEFRAPTFYIRISHSRMGEEDASTSPDIHIRTF